MEASDPSTFYLVGTKPGRSLTLSLPSSPSSPSHMCYLLKRKLDRPSTAPEDLPSVLASAFDEMQSLHFCQPRFDALHQHGRLRGGK